MNNRESDRGFSLLEALVAIAVLAVAASTILRATENHVRTITGVTERTHARWIAENRLAQSRAGVEGEPTVSMAGRSWDIDVQRAATADPDLERVDIAVSRQGSALAELTGFLARPKEATR